MVVTLNVGFSTANGSQLVQADKYDPTELNMSSVLRSLEGIWCVVLTETYG